MDRFQHLMRDGGLAVHGVVYVSVAKEVPLVGVTIASGVMAFSRNPLLVCYQHSLVLK